MPYNLNTGVYSATTGAETATAGAIIASATWDQINVDYRTALTSLGKGVLPILTSGNTVSHYYTAQVATVNFAASASDIATFAITLPVSVSTFRVESLRIGNAAASLAGVSVSLFTGAGATGVAIITSTATTVTTGAANTPNNYQTMIPANTNSEVFTAANVFLHVSASNAGSSTASVTICYNPAF